MLLLMSQLVFPNKNNLLSESTMQIMQWHRIAYQTQVEKATKKIDKNSPQTMGRRENFTGMKLGPTFLHTG